MTPAGISQGRVRTTLRRPFALRFWRESRARCRGDERVRPSAQIDAGCRQVRRLPVSLRVRVPTQLKSAKPGGESLATPRCHASPLKGPKQSRASDTVDGLSRELHRLLASVPRETARGHHSSLELPKSIPAELARRSPIFETASPTCRTTLSNATIGVSSAIPSSASAAFESELLR